MTKKTILVTGSTGTIGFEVLKQLYLQTDKYHVIALATNKNKSKKKMKPFLDKINMVYGDIRNKKFLQEICKNIDVVIHLAAIIPPLADEDPTLTYQVNTLGTSHLIAALEKNSPKAFLLYSSSISVYGDRVKTPFINITDKLLPSERDEYAVTKIETEKNIQNSTLDYSIFRLTAIMGEHKMSKIMFHVPLESSMEICTPEDTARAFVNAIEKTKLLSKNIYNLGGGENMRLTYKELLEKSFKAFGMGKLDFPKYAFASQNFHCGFYADGDKLEDIVKFRTDNLKTYFEDLSKETSSIIRVLTKIFSKIVKYFMLRQSEPYHAFKNKNQKELLHYFGTTSLKK